MVAIFISFCIVVLSFNFFMMSHQINGINRLVLSAPLSLFETAIVMYEIDEKTGPYFDKEILVDNITSYFNYHMARYTGDYSLSYYYYRPRDHSLDMSNKPKAVEVTVNANLILSFDYSRVMYYEIWSN